MGEITEYDLDTLQPLGSFPGFRALVNLNGLRFSNDGKILIASSLDRTFSIYDVATRTRLGDTIPSEFTTGALGIPFLRPDGMAVAVGSSDGIVIWDLDPEHLASSRLPLRRTQPHPHRMGHPPRRTRRLPTDLP